MLQALIISNGAYGDRMVKICSQAGFNYDFLRGPEDQALDLGVIKEKLCKSSAKYSLVAAVHCETSTGMINSIQNIGQIVKEHSKGMQQ